MQVRGTSPLPSTSANLGEQGQGVVRSSTCPCSCHTTPARHTTLLHSSCSSCCVGQTASFVHGMARRPANTSPCSTMHSMSSAPPNAGGGELPALLTPPPPPPLCCSPPCPSCQVRLPRRERGAPRCSSRMPGCCWTGWWTGCGHQMEGHRWVTGVTGVVPLGWFKAVQCSSVQQRAAIR
jgi:hypothetical protein